MDHDAVERLQASSAWKLLRADNAPLILAFCGRHFVEQNHGATPATALADALDDLLYSLNAGLDEPRYRKSAPDYLEDWASDGHSWLRRFYPAGSDEVHYDATPALEKAYSWVESLQIREFVGTESRLETVVALLRQIVHGAETDAATRLAELHRRRDELDAEIQRAEAGEIEVLSGTALRERYHQAGATAREILADFRQVEENFRALDRSARAQIAGWTGGKGELLAELVGDRASIAGSDQGVSFQAFYDFLLSESRQDELTDLLDAAARIDQIDADERLRGVQHDWSDAAERTQGTVRQLSEQLRRFLDDQVWIENRRVLELVRGIERSALGLAGRIPPFGLTIDEPGVDILLPFERPLYDAVPASRVDSLLDPSPAEDVDIAALFEQTYVDSARLATNIRSVVPPGSAAELVDIVRVFPVEQGAAELVAYLALPDDDLHLDIDETQESLIEISDHESTTRRVRLPKVTVSRQ